MNNDIKMALFALVVAFIVLMIAISFNFTKGTPSIIAIVTFILIYFMGKLERIENKLDEIYSIKRSKK